ncbi:glycosyltransferase family 2 protein [Nisaea acidiphila]|uniref:Glycosyltransferase family 2 protein n=1 Tax=Nisaea acidiphila TaxID=1862145 RepID=A0A9J7AMB6_9PROT|nr:glycosyltransferase family 2 protein [Nisaea acidiphila]UUX48311.1 glycosyltransferase family 2 protein [Nisaea acidiphila]
MSVPIPPTERPDCAVVIVSYRTGPCLMECIRSVLGEMSAREIVVVDNGNPAEMVSALRALAETEERLTLLTGHGNVGFGRACNMGAARTTSPFLLLLNPDSVLKPGSLDGAMDRLASRQDISLYTVRIEDPDGSEQRGCRRNLMTPWTCLVEVSGLHRLGFKRINLHGTPPPEDLEEVECISGSFLLFRREVFEAIGGMDEDYFLHMEDVDVCFRVRAAGGSIWFDPTLSASHVQGTSEATSLFIEEQKTRGGVLYFSKHFGGWPNPLVLLVNIALWTRFLLLRIRTIF